MRFKNYFFALFLVGLLTGCKDNATEPNNTPQEIMPLKTGNIWTYKETVTQIQDATTITTEETYIASISGITSVNAEDWFDVKNFLGKGDNALLQNKSDGVWFSAGNTSGLFFKYPAEVNSTFTNQGGTFTLVSTSANVQSGNKSYTCYQYSTVSQAGTEINYYVAPGVGLVKATRDRVGNGEDIHFMQELQSYILK